MADLDQIQLVRDLLISSIQTLSRLMPFADSSQGYFISELLAQLSDLSVRVERPDPMLVAQMRTVISRLQALLGEFKAGRATPMEAEKTLTEIRQITANLAQNVDSLAA